MNRRCVISFIIFVLLPLLLQAKELPALVVWDLYGQGIAEIQANMLSDAVRSAITETGSYLVIGREEMNTVREQAAWNLSEECQQGDAPSCYVEIGGALGAQMIVTGKIQQSDSVTMVTLKLIDMLTVGVSSSRQFVCEQCTLVALLSRTRTEAVLLVQSSSTEWSDMRAISSDDQKPDSSVFLKQNAEAGKGFTGYIMFGSAGMATTGTLYPGRILSQEKTRDDAGFSLNTGVGYALSERWALYARLALGAGQKQLDDDRKVVDEYKLDMLFAGLGGAWRITTGFSLELSLGVGAVIFQEPEYREDGLPLNLITSEKTTDAFGRGGMLTLAYTWWRWAPHGIRASISGYLFSHDNDTYQGVSTGLLVGLGYEYQ
jgi:hypothetical protein